MTEQDQLDELTDRLHRRIATSPPHSHTARVAQQQLDTFERAGSGFTTAEKVAALTTTLRSYQRGLQLENILHHPGDRRPGE